MGVYYSEADVKALAVRLDGHFLAYHFDQLQEPTKRSALAAGRGTRSQTARRYFLSYMLRETFECEEVLVSKVLRKDRSVIRDGVVEMKKLLLSADWGPAMTELCDIAYRNEQFYLGFHTRSDEAATDDRRKELIGWRASPIAIAFLLYAQSLAFREPKRMKEFVAEKELVEIEDIEEQVRLANRTIDARRARAKASTETARAMAEENRQRIAQIVPQKSPPPPKSDTLKPSHPAIVLIERNRTLFSELKPLVCVDRALPGDYSNFATCSIEPDLIKGRGERVRVSANVDKSTLVTAVDKMIRLLSEANYRPALQMAPTTRPKGGSYALITVKT